MVQKNSTGAFISGLVMVVGCGLISHDVDAARVEGRVSESSERIFLESAIVKIDELNLQVSSQRDGRYSFADVPAGTYTLIVDYIGAPRVEKKITVSGEGATVVDIVVGNNVRPMENIIVYGQAGSTANALNQQRAADNLVSVVSSDDVGTLPDTNIAEALQRVPGAFIERDQGEGRYVGIRGLSPSLNSVKINGVNVAAPDSDQRAVALDVLPSDLLETLEISKSFTPEQDGDAIGGTINVRSLSAFDREGRYWKLNTESAYSQLEEENSPKLSGVFTDTFSLGDGHDNFGVAAAISYSERNFGSENIEHDGGWVQEGAYYWAEEPEHRDYVVTRERFGLALNFDFRPSDTSSYYLRTLYSDFEDDEIRNRIEVKPDEDTLFGLSQNAGSFAEAEHERSLKDRTETQEIISVVLGGINEVDTWTVEYSMGYSYAEEDEPGRIDTEFQGGDYPFSWTGLGATPNYQFSAAHNDPTEYELDEMVVENNLVEDEELSFQVDLTNRFDFNSNPAELKFGVKYRAREKDRASTIQVYDDFGSFGDPDASAFTTRNVDYSLANFGFGLDRKKLRSFRKNLTEANLNAGETLTESTVGDYQMDEDIVAGYIQAKVDFDRLRLIGGVRYEYTDFKSNGFTGAIYESETLDLETSGFGKSSDEGDYSYFMPSLVVRYELNDEVVLRGSISQTIARPSFGSLNPSSLAEIEEEDGDVEFAIEDLGNSNLDPYESLNLDFSGEWYPGDIGVVSAALFYKNVDNFIAQRDVSNSLDLTPWLDLVGLTPGDITDIDALQYQNGDDADIYGLELAYARHFDNGLMIGFNATLTDSEGDFDGRNIDLPQSAEEITNVVLGYENHNIRARLAYNYISERLIVVGDDKTEDVYQDDHGQLDLSLSYNITDNIQVYFEGINLTDEPYYAYQGGNQYNWQYEEYGRAYVVGITITQF